MIDGYQEITVIGVIKRFIVGWLLGGLALTVYSCVKYREYIGTVFTDSVVSWINAIIPVVIWVFAINYIIKSGIN